MNLYVTCGAVSVLRVLIMLRAGRLNRTNAMIHAMTRQTKMVNRAVSQHAWIS